MVEHDVISYVFLIAMDNVIPNDSSSVDKRSRQEKKKTTKQQK